MLKHKSVKPTLSNKKKLIAFYGKYADGTIRNEHYDMYYKLNRPEWLKWITKFLFSLGSVDYLYCFVIIRILCEMLIFTILQFLQF